MGYKVKRILVGTQQVRPRLPSAYQEVEYIEGTGTQWINTGIKPSSNISTEITLRPNMSYVSEQAIFGDNWSANSLFFMVYQGYYRLHNGGTVNNIATITDVKTTIFINNAGITINGTFYTLVAGSTYSTPNNTIYLYTTGDLQHTGTKVGHFKTYSFKIRDSGTLVRDLVPCYRKLDGVIGLYDLGNNTFCTNSGTGTFTKGPNVN